MVHAQRLLPLEQLLSSVNLGDDSNSSWAGTAGSRQRLLYKVGLSGRGASAAGIHLASAGGSAHGRRRVAFRAAIVQTIAFRGR